MEQVSVELSCAFFFINRRLTLYSAVVLEKNAT